jgi:alkanesulfonate monooxygenase SsuD/methylene tetrahydromethanopterin reductase-like flavin-dependent oxidoreductase (luciferase family)
MQVGLQLGYQNLHGMPDADFFRAETQLAVEAEAMGFDYVAPVEHHFTDYAACPDNFQVLTYIAAKTKTLKLMTGAVMAAGPRAGNSKHSGWIWAIRARCSTKPLS